jgi:hypothetical protein
MQILTLLDAPLTNFVFQDNLVSNGQAAISGCRGRTGTEVLEECARGFVFVNNVVVDSGGDFPKSNGSYKKEKEKDKKVNLYPKKWRDVGFANLVDHGRSDYRLCSTQGQPAASCSAARGSLPVR